MSTEISSYDVIVIGGGLSGLTVAHTIQKRNSDLSVLVLEAKDRVGGRTYTVPLITAGGTDQFDLGGQWVGKSQKHMMEMLDELNIKWYQQYTTGKKLNQVVDRKIRSYTGRIPNMPIISLIETEFNLRQSDHRGRQVCVHHPFNHPKAKEWDSISLGSILDKGLHTKAAKNTIDVAIRTVFGCESSQISYLYFLLYIQTSGGMSKLIEDDEYSAQEGKIDGGAQQLSIKLSKRIGNDKVKLNAAVSSIQQTESCVIVTTEEGWEAKASRIVIAAPPSAIEKINFRPRLLENRIDFMKQMRMGNYIKVIITYEKAFWRTMGFSGEAVSDGGVAMKDLSSSFPLSVVYDNATASESPALLGFISGRMAVEWSMRPAKERQQAVIDHLMEFFGNQAGKYLDYIEKDWAREPHTCGGPVSFLTVGGMENFSQAIRQTDGRIHYAGTETATAWTGYMSGAIQAGERAAYEVIEHLSPGSLNENDRAVLKAHSIESKICPECATCGTRSWTSRLILIAGLLLVPVAAYVLHKAQVFWY